MVRKLKKQSYRKTIAELLVLCIILTVSIWGKGVLEVKGANRTDDQFNLSYDKNNYNIYWMSRHKITCYSQYGSMWSNLDKGDKLGTATIRFCYLEPKNKKGSDYYAIGACMVSMDPVDVAGNITGMSQMADFEIKTINPDSRVCSPTANILEIQAANSDSKKSNFTAGAGVKYNSTDKKWEASSELNLGKSWASNTTYTYNMSNVNLTQKNKNGQYASWSFDYISKNKDKVWNAYLMSSSKVAGQIVYRLNAKPTGKNRSTCAPAKIKYDIRFGAGNKTTGAVANRLGASTNRDMSIMTGTIKLLY